MPEKSTEKVETNGRPMPETPPEKVQETARKQTQHPESAPAQDAVRAYNNLMATTTKYYFDIMGNLIRDNMELANRVQHDVEDVMTIYRRSYTEGFKSWQAYWQDVSKMFARPR